MIDKVWVLVEREGLAEEILVGASNDEGYVERCRDALRSMNPERTYFIEAIDFIQI